VPKGVYNSAKANCRKCDPPVQFASLGELRKHQWAAHRESYANTIAAARKNGRLAKGKVGRPAKRPVLSTSANGVNRNMPISDVLDELKDQRKYLDDFISTIEEIMRRKR
jgi:hypothetical protein